MLSLPAAHNADRTRPAHPADACGPRGKLRSAFRTSGTWPQLQQVMGTGETCPDGRHRPARCKPLMWRLIEPRSIDRSRQYLGRRAGPDFSVVGARVLPEKWEPVSDKKHDITDNERR